jgi:hypothetical protein
MLTISGAEGQSRRRRNPSAHSNRQPRQDALTRAVALIGGGDTYALNWRSDPRLLAILARAAHRERNARGDRPPARQAVSRAVLTRARRGEASFTAHETDPRRGNGGGA